MQCFSRSEQKRLLGIDGIGIISNMRQEADPKRQMHLEAKDRMQDESAVTGELHAPSVGLVLVRQQQGSPQRAWPHCAACWSPGDG